MAKTKGKSELDLFLDYTQTYMEACADVMRLGYHTIILERDLLEESPDEDFESDWMRIHPVPDQKRFFAAVGQPFIDSTPEEKVITIAHELAHIHLQRITNTVQSLFRKHVPSTMWETMRAQVERSEELTADELGRIIAPLLPKWSYKKSK